jgi:hypothetical protein
MKREKEVQELARKLDNWAQEELPETQQTLLRLLVSRCQEVEPKIEIREPAYAYKKDIRQAVMDALRHIDRSASPKEVPLSPKDNWTRGPIWPRAGIWPRA